MKYLVLPMISKIREKLTLLTMLDEESISKNMASEMLDDFEIHWGGPDFWHMRPGGQLDRSGPHTRQVGIHPVLIIASFLDPRFKSMNWLTIEKLSSMILLNGGSYMNQNSPCWPNLPESIWQCNKLLRQLGNEYLVLHLVLSQQNEIELIQRWQESNFL
jgi:hypothetical protein